MEAMPEALFTARLAKEIRKGKFLTDSDPSIYDHMQAVSADRLLIPGELMRDYRNLGSYERMTNQWESVITRQLTGLRGPEKKSLYKL